MVVKMDQTDQHFSQLHDIINNTPTMHTDDLETGQKRRGTPSDSSGQYYSTSTDYDIALVDRTGNYASSQNPQSSPRPPKSIRQQFNAFLTMSMPYFRTSSSGRHLFALMIILTLLNSGIRVYFSYLARDFWNALSEKDADQFYGIMVTFCLAMVGLTPVSVAYRYVRQMLAISWREWTTLRVLGLFMKNRAYYSLERGCYSDNVVGKSVDEVDNPDQRISEDIRSFTEFSLSLFLTTLTAVIDLVCFSFILFSIMPRLFLAIFLFASTGTILTICIGKRLISLNYEALQKEADFRFTLVRIRENAESIAFYCGEGVEKRETERRFEKVIDNMG